MPDWVTFAACFAAKEVHQCSLSFPSQQLPLATLQLPAEAKCQWSGDIRRLWNLTPQRTHRMTFSLSQAHFLHISLAQEGSKVRTGNKVSASVIFYPSESWFRHFFPSVRVWTWIKNALHLGWFCYECIATSEVLQITLSFIPERRQL